MTLLDRYTTYIDSLLNEFPKLYSNLVPKHFYENKLEPIRDGIDQMKAMNETFKENFEIYSANYSRRLMYDQATEDLTFDIPSEKRLRPGSFEKRTEELKQRAEKGQLVPLKGLRTNYDLFLTENEDRLEKVLEEYWLSNDWRGDIYGKPSFRRDGDYEHTEENTYGVFDYDNLSSDEPTEFQRKMETVQTMNARGVQRSLLNTIENEDLDEDHPIYQLYTRLQEREDLENNRFDANIDNEEEPMEEEPMEEE